MLLQLTKKHYGVSDQCKAQMTDNVQQFEFIIGKNHNYHQRGESYISVVVKDKKVVADFNVEDVDANKSAKIAFASLLREVSTKTTQRSDKQTNINIGTTLARTDIFLACGWSVTLFEENTVLGKISGKTMLKATLIKDQATEGSKGIFTVTVPMEYLFGFCKQPRV